MIGRIGFVSNSSASSFLIWAKKYSSNVDKMENLLDSEQVAILENAGFKKTRCMFASDIDKNLNVVDFMVDKEDVQYSYFLWVSCNQVDIADFLVDNHIPFDASCHYGHYHLFYDGNEDGEVLKLLNMGNEYETYRKAHFTTDRLERYAQKLHYGSNDKNDDSMLKTITSKMRCRNERSE